MKALPPLISHDALCSTGLKQNKDGVQHPVHFACQKMEPPFVLLKVCVCVRACVRLRVCVGGLISFVVHLSPSSLGPDGQTCVCVSE